MGVSFLGPRFKMSATQSVQTFGKKKTATAVALAKEGKGLIKVNGVPLSLYGSPILRGKLYQPVPLLQSFTSSTTSLASPPLAHGHPPPRLGRWTHVAAVRPPPGHRQGGRCVRRQVRGCRVGARGPHGPRRCPASLRAEEVRRQGCALALPEVVPLSGPA